MTDITIPPGAYRLDRDIINPRPDKRMTRDWRMMPVWAKGTEFIVRENHNDSAVYNDLAPEVAERLRAASTYTTIEHRYASLYRIGPGDSEKYATLADALVLCELPSLTQFMARIDCQEGFATWLVESGELTRERFEVLWSRYQRNDMAEKP